MRLVNMVARAGLEPTIPGYEPGGLPLTYLAMILLSNNQDGMSTILDYFLDVNLNILKQPARLDVMVIDADKPLGIIL